ncbi:MAG TPA: glycoside hydrolase domain-containing protein, partial [Phytomonospora sp.]
ATGNRYKIGVYGSRNVCDRVTKGSAADWSFVSGMSWGFSGNLGYALPQTWVYNQIKEFDFTWSGGSFGLDRDVMRPGKDVSVDRVVGRTATASEFIAHVEELFQAVTERRYLGDNSGVTYPIPVVHRNTLIWDYLRLGSYDRDPWGEIPGDTWIEQDWIAHATEVYGGDRITRIVDAGKGLDLDVGKLALATGGGIRGWFGDLCEFYGEWRGRHEDYPDGELFANAFLAKAGVESSFSSRDFQADADGAAYRRYLDLASDGVPPPPASSGTEGQKIHNLLAAIWDRPAEQRAYVFYESVFGATRQGVRDVAAAALDTANADAVQLMIRQSGEDGMDLYFDELVDERRRQFLDGFANVVIAKAGE